MNHILKLRLEVGDEPNDCEATRDVDNTETVTRLIVEFLERFGDPDRGPQKITITLMSTP